MAHGALHRAILNNIPDQAWLKDADSRYILVNDAFMEACGHSEREILGATPDKVWPVAWGKIYLSTDRAVLSSGERRRYEESRYGADGTLRWFDTVKMPIRDKDDRIVGTVGISRDITDRKRSEQALERLNRLYALRSKTNQVIVQIAQPDALLSRVCRIAVKIGGLTLAWAFLRDERGHVACVGHANAKPLHTRYAQQMNAVAHDRWMPPTASARVHVCRNIRKATRFHAQAAAAADLGMTSFAALPLTQAGRTVGYCLLFACEAEYFSADVVKLLQALSRDLSFALDSIAEAEKGRRTQRALLDSQAQLRELSAYLQSVREEERARLSRELHDELGQLLTALRLGLNYMQPQSDGGAACGPAGLPQHVAMLKKLVDETVDAVHRIASDLRPAVLDELGLPAAIEWLAESYAQRSGIRCELRMHAPGPLDPARSTAIFRIVQEALTNACRHGHADCVVIEINEKAQSLEVAITDNGCGMDMAGAGQRRSLGLVGMRERALILGGQLTIHSRPGRGTRVVANIPRVGAAPTGVPS